MTALLEELVRAPSGQTGWETPLAPGDLVGRFEIRREIGRGGFGVVYEALDRELGRSVAFKAVRAATLVDDRAILSEAESAARLAHPNIVHLYDVGRSEQGPYLIMELLRGETLSARLRRGPITAREAVRIAVDLSRGLAHAHEHGVVHRDLKPANVFLCEDGQVKVLDFGLAAVFGRSDASGGTPGYMAPEQHAGALADERCDVYALGTIVEEMLTGSAQAGPSASVKHAGAAPRGSAGLWRLVDRMRAAEPMERPPDAARAHAEILAVARSLEPRRHAVIAWSVAAVALAAAAFAGVYLRKARLPEGRLVVAIADVQNATADSGLDGVPEMLEIALAQSSRLSIVPRPRLLAHAAPAAERPARLDEQHARAAAGAVNAQVLVVPAIRRVGDGFEAELRAHALPGDAPLLVARERAAARGAIPDALDRLSSRLLAAVQARRGEPAGPRIPLSSVAPAEAWLHYAEATRLQSEGRRLEAIAAFQRATEADPEFPLAHIALAFEKKFYLSDEPSARRHVEVALARLDRLPPKARALVQAIHARLELRTADAITHYDRMIAAQPDDPAPYLACGEMIVNHWGDRGAARPYLTKALELDATSDSDAVRLLLELERYDEALVRAEHWLETSPESSVPPLALAAIHTARGDVQAAVAAARRALAAGAPALNWHVLWAFLDADALDELEQRLEPTGKRSFQLLAVRGRTRAALAALDENRPPANAPARASAMFHNRRADLVAATGDPALVWREVEAQLRLGLADARCGGYLLAWLGDLERADHFMTLWSEVDPRQTCLRMHREVASWRRGDPGAALRGLETMSGWNVEYLRAEILADLGRDREAVDQFREARRSSVGISGLVFYPRSLYLEAASLERLGERAEARRVLDRFLRLWQAADRDDATLRKARALGARLPMAAAGDARR